MTKNYRAYALSKRRDSAPRIPAPHKSIHQIAGERSRDAMPAKVRTATEMTPEELSALELLYGCKVKR